MSSTFFDNSGPAFPRPDSGYTPGSAGMTLRDWFAGQALVGFLAHDDRGTHSPEVLAQAAYYHADQMLKVRRGE